MLTAATAATVRFSATASKPSIRPQGERGVENTGGIDWVRREEGDLERFAREEVVHEGERVRRLGRPQ